MQPAARIPRRRDATVGPVSTVGSRRKAREKKKKNKLSRYRAVLANLNPFLAEDVLARPCFLFRVPPHFCKGVLRRAPHVGGVGEIHLARAWKLWLFLPRMLLHRPAGGALVEKPVLLARFQ